MKKNKKWLSVLLAVCMVLTTLIPAFSAFANEAKNAAEEFVNAVAAAEEWNDDLKTLYDAIPGSKDSGIPASTYGKFINLAVDKVVKDGTTAREDVFNKVFGKGGIIDNSWVRDSVRNAALLAGIPFGAKDGNVTINGNVYKAETVAAYLTFDFSTDEQKNIVKDIAAEYQKTENGLLRQTITTYVDVTAEAIKGLEAADVTDLAGFMGAYAKCLVAEGTAAADIEAAIKTAVKFRDTASVGGAYKAIADYRDAVVAYETDKNKEAYDAATKAFEDAKAKNEFVNAFVGSEAAIFVVDGAVASFAAVQTKVDKLAADDFVASLDKYVAANYKTVDEVKAAIAEIDAAYNAMTANAKASAKDAYDAKKAELKAKQDELQKAADEAEANKFIEERINPTFDAIPAEPTVEFNETIRTLKADYKKLSSGAKKAVEANTDAWGKYNKIIAASVKEVAENTHVAPESIVVSGKDTIVNDIIAESVAPNLNGLLPMVAKLINPNATTISGAISSYFSNEGMTELAKMIGPVLDSIVLPEDIMLVGGKPVFCTLPTPVAKQMEQSYAGNEQLKDVPAQLKAIESNSWADAPVIDWGIKDGDYETFKTAFLAFLDSSLNAGNGNDGAVGQLLFMMIIDPANFFDDKYTMTPDGSAIDYTETYKNSFYSRLIIPLFEMLGVTDYMSATEYSEFYKANQLRWMTGVLEPILDELWLDVIPRLEADPAGFIGEYLPGIIYHLDAGCAFEEVETVLDISILGMINLKDEINKMIAGLGIEGVAGLGDMNLKAILGLVLKDMSAEQVDAIYSMIAKVSQMGTAYNKEIENLAYESLTLIDGDESSVVNYVANTLLDVVADLLKDNGINLDFAAGTFVPVALPKYPHNGDLNKDVVNKTIAGLDETVLSLVNIDELVNNAVATNENAALLLKGLYGELAKVPELVQMGIAVTPDQVAAALGSAKQYKELVEALSGKTSWDDVVLTIKNDKGEVKYQTNMGFTDGDFDGFVNAVVAYLRPLAKTLISTGMFLNNGAEGSYGLYETLIIPVYEALGLSISSNSATLTKMYADAVKAMGEDAACDVVLKEVLAPVLDLVADVKAAPISTVLDKLPTIAYALQYNPDVAFIGNMLKNDKGEIDLAAMINPMLKDLGITLPYIDLDLLASAGTVKDLASVSLRRDTYKAVVADKADAFIVVMNYVGDTIKYGKNLDAIKNLLKDVDLGSMEAVVTDLLGKIGAMSNDDLICMLATMFGGYTCPDAAEGEGGDGEIGDMGDYAIGIGSVLAVFAAAGVALVLLRRRKKVND